MHRKQILHSLFFIVSFAAPSLAAGAFACAPDENSVACAALGDLYAATGGASWTNKAGWVDAAAGTATSYCTFYGVACDANNVIKL